MLQITLKELRESRSYSQAKLAELLGVGQSTVAMWENGKNKPEHSALLKIAVLFGVTTSYLIGGEEKMGKVEWSPDQWKDYEKGSPEEKAKMINMWGCPTELVESLTEKEPLTDDEELNEYLEELRTRPELRMMFQLSKKATKKDVEIAVKIIEAMLGK